MLYQINKPCFHRLISLVKYVLFFLLITPAHRVVAQNGATLFQQYCSICHAKPTEKDTPGIDTLAKMEVRAVFDSMDDGFMRLQARALSREQKIAVAEFITGSRLTVATELSNQGQCDNPLVLNPNSEKPRWSGWGLDAANRRFQSGETKINASNVGKLKLRWAFGIADATQARSQPAVVDDKLFMSSQTGTIYALGAKSGCTYWTYRAKAGARNAMSLAQVEVAGQQRPLLFFADAHANAYALDAETGELIWTTQVDNHPAATATGSPAYYNGVLYVVLSGVSEESSASKPDYECCKFRGSLTALDARTGKTLWKTYTVGEPKPRGKNAAGTQLWGPAGVPIWASPTIDSKRGLIYAASGNAYADPPSGSLPLGNSDAIIAFSLKTGAIQWVQQIHNDVWIMGCDAQSTGGDINAGDNPNCPNDVGPDYDFSASPILVTPPNGKDILVATQKSGMAYALDPDKRGKLLWQYRWGQGSPAGGVWGAAVDRQHAYFAVADQLSPQPGGLKAVNLVDGKEVWSVPPHQPLCGKARNCNAAQSAAVTVIPGVVFSGSMDGGIRAYDSSTGKMLWTFDTNQRFKTVNGVDAKGGSIDGPGPVVVDGMLYVTSGNGGFFGRPGNVLLAFAISDN